MTQEDLAPPKRKRMRHDERRQAIIETTLACLARDGAEAIICVAEHRAELRLVITDLHMPHLDGASFIRLLRRMDQKIPVIVTSGLIGDKLAAELNSLGVEYTLMKPFNYGQLMRAIHTVLPPPAPAK